MVNAVGKDLGTALTGWLFTSKGTTTTLCCYSIVTALFLAIWMVYICTAKHLGDYMKIPSEEEEAEEEAAEKTAEKAEEEGEDEGEEEGEEEG